MDRATSRNGVPVRLTDERWVHIVENHDDLAEHDDVLDAIESPDMIIEGSMAARWLPPNDWRARSIFW